MTEEFDKELAPSSAVSRRSADELAAEINVDRPCVSLSEDAFDFEPTVRAIARTIRLAPAHRGLVLHIDGEWGTGKSSALAFVKQLLSEHAAPSERSTILDFSPWWFSDREDLAKQFLLQLRLQLPRENKILMAAGALIADYSEQLGHVVGVGVSAVLGAPLPGADKVASAAFRKLKPAEKTLPQLKEQICEALASAKRRIVVFVDDVDRLAPNEIDQLFRVIKAVADFPNVVYVLAFDSQQVAKALEAQLKVDGQPYLEKIVQVPFLLPIASVDKLRALLEARIRAIVGNDLPQDSYTKNVLEAMANLVRRPRDLARFSNAFSCTYPAIAGEVHPADAAALDLLRLLGLQVFWAIRDHHEDFIGIVGFDRDGKMKERQLAFHATWRQGLPEKRAGAVDHLVELLFPYMREVRWGRKAYGSDSRLLSTEGRVASAWGHSVYFHLRAPEWALSHQRRDELFRIEDPEWLLKEWGTLVAHGRRGEMTQATELLLEVELWQVSAGFARAFIHSVLRVDDQLYRNGDGRRLSSDIVTKPFTHCVERLERDHLENVLVALSNATSLCGMTQVVRRYLQWQDAAQGQGAVLPHWLDEKGIADMKTLVVRRLSLSAAEGTLLRQPRAIDLVGFWFKFSPDTFEPWLRMIVAGDTLIELIEAFLYPQGPASEGMPGTDMFYDQVLADLLPTGISMANLSEGLDHLGATVPALWPRTNRLATYLRAYLKKQPSASGGALAAPEMKNDAPRAQS
jgi:hypothetical protein